MCINPKIVFIGLLAATTILKSAGAADVKARRVSADGITFPPVVFPVAGSRNLDAKGIASIASYLNRPPEEVGSGVMSSTQSKSALRHHMERFYDVQTAVRIDDGVYSHGEVTHGLRSVFDVMPTSWFVTKLNGSGATVIGFDLADGVISRILLYYQRTTPLVEKLKASLKASEDDGFVYRIAQFEDVTYIELLKSAPIYLFDHPHLLKNTCQALSEHRIIEDMNLDEAIASLGEPDYFYEVDGAEITTMFMIGDADMTLLGMKTSREKKVARSWNLGNGTVWSCVLEKNKLHDIDKKN